MSFIFYLRGPYKICDRQQTLYNNTEPHSSLPLRIYLSSTLIVACVYVETIKYVSLNRRSGPLSQRWMDEKRMGNSQHYVIFPTLAAAVEPPPTPPLLTLPFCHRSRSRSITSVHHPFLPSMHKQTGGHPGAYHSPSLAFFHPTLKLFWSLSPLHIYIYILPRLLYGRSSTTVKLSASSFRGP